MTSSPNGTRVAALHDSNQRLLLMFVVMLGERTLF